MYTRTCTCPIAHLTASLGASLGVLDDALEGHGCLQHQGLLAGDHLAVDGVVEVGHLGEREKKREEGELAWSPCMSAGSSPSKHSDGKHNSSWVVYVLVGEDFPGIVYKQICVK